MSRTRHPSLSRAPWMTLAAALLLAACGPGRELPSIEPRGEPGVTRGVPGFDTRDYPGTAAMRAWRDASPYRWVGYYLTGAPC